VIDSIDFRKYSAVNAYAEVAISPEDNTACDVIVYHNVNERDDGSKLVLETSVRVYLPEKIGTVLARVTELIIGLMAHEVREALHYRGRRIYDPHTVTGRL
jgi:hypothetical protein